MKKINYSIYATIIFCQLFISIGYSADSSQSTSDSAGKNVAPQNLNAQQKAMAKQFEELKKQMKLMQKGYNPAVKSTSAPPHARKFRKSLTKEQSKALREKNITTIPKHKLAGEWKNKYGDVVRLQSSGHFYSKIHKNIFWESRKNRITFYDVTHKSSGELIKGLRATYDNKADAITIIGNKYKAFPYYRYDDAHKEKERLAKIQKREKDRKIIRRSLLQDKKSKEEPKVLIANFYETLTCNNCDLTILKTRYLDCSWCEAQFSKFTKKGRIWSFYKFAWANLKGADFSGTVIRDTTFYKANLKGADFSGAKIGKTNFAFADLENANFRNAEIGESIFNGANLKNADFTGATIIRADFSFSNQADWVFKPKSKENVKLKASSIDNELVGVWYRKGGNGLFDIGYYYEFFEDGSYLYAEGNYKKEIGEMGKPGHVKRIAQSKYYSVRDGIFISMAPQSFFKDPFKKTKININGNLLTFSKDGPTYTRANGKSLDKYKSFRNNDYALITAYRWNNHLIDKFSADGVNYSSIHSLHSKDIFDHLFGKIRDKGIEERGHLVVQDRQIKHIFSSLIRNNKEFRSGTNYENMVFYSVNYGYVETLKYLLPQATKKIDLEYALIKYDRLNPGLKDLNGKNSRTSKGVGLLKKRISEL